ncbi:MAG TPA: EAL domain-containing protein [Allosphingosinicella sp.]|nr:EAL domain-containing protein [Allosphingosinicella sp.]
MASVGCFVLLFRRAKQLRLEIARREESEDRAVKLARHDPLTGLANRRVLEEDLAASLIRVKAASSECAVFLIDLDHFKSINDTHGHVVGDSVLVELSDRLSEILHGRGTVARMGGDEFACIVPYSTGDDLPTRLAAQIVRRMSEPVQIGTLSLEPGASVGIARAPHDGETASELLHGADLAMYEGKREKRGSYRFFHAEMDQKLRERTTLEKELRCALADGEIVPHFQQVMDLATGKIIGFEALARWRHPTRGMIPPDTFIPLAEDIGIIDQVTFSMLHSACSAARDWPDSTWLAVNVSPVQLDDPWLAARLLAILSEAGFPAGRLVVEVTENAVIEDIMKAQDIFTSLQNAGVRIALDDFGKGYSSLYHLRELKFDHLKIDRSFIHSMDCSESAKIVSAVAGLGKSMGMPVTAEGVETLAEAEALRELGCEHAQGYLFGKALSREDTLALLRGDEDGAPLRRTA